MPFLLALQCWRGKGVVFACCVTRFLRGTAELVHIIEKSVGRVTHSHATSTTPYRFTTEKCARERKVGWSWRTIPLAEFLEFPPIDLESITNIEVRSVICWRDSFFLSILMADSVIDCDRITSCYCFATDYSLRPLQWYGGNKRSWSKSCDEPKVYASLNPSILRKISLCLHGLFYQPIFVCTLFPSFLAALALAWIWMRV